MTTWNTPPTWIAKDPISAFRLNQVSENLNWLKTRPQEFYYGDKVAVISLTSTSLISVDTTLFRRTIQTTGGVVLYGLVINYMRSNTGGAATTLDLLIDDTTYLSTMTAVSSTLGMAYYNRLDASDYVHVNNVWPVLNLAAGEHTLELVAKVSSGTTTFSCLAGSAISGSWVLEV